VFQPFRTPESLAFSHVGELLVSESFVRQMEANFGNLDAMFKSQTEEVLQDHPILDHRGEAVDWAEIPVKHVDGISEEDYDLEGLFLEYFPNLTRCGALVLLYGDFEEWLVGVAGLASEYWKEPAPQYPKDTSKIAAANSYLETIGVSIGPDATSSFAEIDIIRWLRNGCAHNRARIPEHQEDARAYAEGSEHVQLGTWGELYLGPGFLPHFLDLQRQFAEGLTSACRARK
jgi:hypothetical protein